MKDEERYKMHAQEMADIIVPQCAKRLCRYNTLPDPSQCQKFPEGKPREYITNERDCQYLKEAK